MGLSNAQLVALRAEFTNDPRGYGYATYWNGGYDNGLSYIVNAIRDGVVRKDRDGNDIPLPLIPVGDGGALDGKIPVPRGGITPADIVHALAMADLPTLATNPNSSALSKERRDLAYLTFISCIDKIKLLNDDGTDTPVMANLEPIFPVGTGTHTRILALKFRNGSRAEELFGPGVVVTASEIAACRTAV